MNLITGLDLYVLDSVSGYFVGHVSFFRMITSLCGTIGIILFAVIGCIAFWSFVSKQRALLYVSALATSLSFSYALKLAFERIRPAGSLVHESSFSFPSGHATVSALIAGILIGWVVRDMRISPWVRRVIIFVAIAFTFFVGLSRVVLRAHYPTDVVVGWCIGALTAYFFERVISCLNKK